MRQRHLESAVVLGGLAALVLGGCATGGSTAKMTPEQTVAERQQLMKVNGASWMDAQNKIKAGNIEAVAVNAETMALLGSQIPTLFPEGSMTDKSKAKPEVWQKWPEFEAAAKNMVAQSEKLRDAAKTNDKAAVEAVAKDFGRQACGTCHQPFRVPPPQQPQQPR